MRRVDDEMTALTCAVCLLHDRHMDSPAVTIIKGSAVYREHLSIIEDHTGKAIGMEPIWPERTPAEPNIRFIG